MTDARRPPQDDDKLHEECGVFGIFGRRRRRRAHRARPARPAASRPGGARHRHLRRRALPRPSRPGPGRRQFRRRAGDRRRCPAARAVGHNRYATTGETVLRNVQPLFADFEFGGFAIAHNGNLTNAHRAAPRAGAPRLPVPVDHRHRGHHPPDRDQPVFDRGRPADRRAEAGEGAYSLVALTNEALIGVRDPLGVRPLVLGPAGRRWRLCAGVARPARSTSSAPTSCATSSRARSSSSTTHGRALHPPVRPAAQPLLHLRIHLLRAARFDRRGHAASTRRASASAPSWRARARSRPTWSCRCRIPACRRRSATPRRAAFRSSSASSATTMSAAPSSSRPTTSAISA